jgi:hypothetical protein
MNDSDAENDPIEVTNVIGPSHGQGGIQPDGTLTYTPDPGFTGDDFIYYTPYDGKDYGQQVSAWISVAANHVPVAVDDHYTAIAGQDVTIDAPGLLSNDTDADNDSLVAFVGFDPQFYGFWTLNQDGSFTFDPSWDYVGDVTLSYGAFDGTKNSNQATLTITYTSAETPTPEPTGTPDDKTPPPSETPDNETATPTPTDSDENETATPIPTDSPGDETPTPPVDESGDETPVASETPSVPTTTDDPTPAPPAATEQPETEVEGVTALPNTGTGTSHRSGFSILTTVFAIVGVCGLSLASRRAKRRTTRRR